MKRLVDRLAAVERRARRMPVYRQGTVDAYRAGPPRVVDVVLAPEGVVYDVPLLEHQTAPSDGDTVWIVNVGPQRWLLVGVQG